jgi:chromosome segregation and condensation protein ScpB
MKTITFEVDNENDLYLLLALAKRLKLKSTVIDENDMTRILDKPEEKPLSAKELLNRLEKAEREEGISFEEFKERVEKW